MITYKVYQIEPNLYDYTEAAGRNPEWIRLRFRATENDNVMNYLMDSIAFERKTTNFSIKIVKAK